MLEAARSLLHGNSRGGLAGERGLDASGAWSTAPLKSGTKENSPRASGTFTKAGHLKASLFASVPSERATMSASYP